MMVYQSTRSNNAQNNNLDKFIIFGNAVLNTGDAIHRTVVREKLAKTL